MQKMKKIKAIHQFTPNVHFGDGVSQGILLTQKLLKDIGYESKIFICSTYVDIRFSNEVYHVSQYIQSTNQVLLYHHSIGHACHDDIMHFIDQKILVYHNITPSHFMKNEAHLQLLCQTGREQLKSAVSYFIGAYADSQYNCDELKYFGYTNPIVLPLLVDLDMKSQIIPTQSIIKKYINTYNIIFVGRIVQNKCQHQLVDVILQLHDKGIRNIKLFIIGGISQLDYFDFLQKYVNDLGLSAMVIFTNKINDQDLAAYYRSANLYLSLSEHEGFGMPLIEAMKYNIPVLAYNAGGIGSTVPEESLLYKKAPSCVAEKIIQLRNNPLYKSNILKKQKQHLKNFTYIILKNKLIDYLASFNIDTPPKETYCSRKTNSFRIEGPFDSSYSLALLNRETAMALKSLGCDVALYSTEGPGDFDPNPLFLQEHSEIEQLYKRSKTLLPEESDVTSRNLFPPRVCDMRSTINMLHHYAWEESEFPQEWVNDFNCCLTGMTTLSTHVEKIMMDNGVSIPLSTSGCGVDHWERIAPDESYHTEAKSFRFLHVSSCFPRKGADILLKAYGDAFCSSDDVTLIIKTFANPHNEIHSWLKEAKKDNENYPDVVIIEDDLTDGQLKALYEQCDVLVAPSRAEGFGLPMAEAMLSGLSVITTGWGGQLDFCNESTAWLIDYTFTPAKTHFELYDSVWAEPSVKHLSNLMYRLYEMPQVQRVQKAEYGRKFLLKDFKWIDVAQRLVHMAGVLAETKELPTPQIGWITSWNTQCGIASYAEHLLDSFPEETAILAPYTEHLLAPDTLNVHRCWHTGDGHGYENLEQTIETLKLDTVVIQFNYSFYDFGHFPSLIEKLHQKSHTIVIMLHSTSDAEITPHKKLSMLASTFKKCDRILVHTSDDLNRLKFLGLVENVSLFPHGIPDWKIKSNTSQNNNIFKLATYGFFLPHKGLLEIIDTVAILRKKGINLKLIMVNSRYPVPQSAELIIKANEKIKTLALENEITLKTDYLSDEACLSELSEADLVVFPYQETGESSSAAVRYGIASGTPVAVTPLKIFDDVEPAVFKLPGTTPEEMAIGLEQLIGQIKINTNTFLEKKDTLQRWIDIHSYHKIGQRLYNTLVSLHRNKTQNLT